MNAPASEESTTVPFEVTSLAVHPGEVTSGETVVIICWAKNTGSAPGSFPVRLKVNGIQKDQQIVEHLGGVIWAARARSSGALFVVELPHGEKGETGDGAV